MAAAAGMEKYRRREMIVKHEYQGEMLSLRAISKAAHVSYKALCKKVKSGLSAEEALERMKMLRGRRFEYRGQMLTLRELSDLCGVSANALYYRIKNGRSVEEAMFVPTRTQKIAEGARSGSNVTVESEPTEQGAGMPHTPYAGRSHGTRRRSDCDAPSRWSNTCSKATLSGIRSGSYRRSWQG